MATVSLPPAAPSSEKLLLSPTADGRARFTRDAYRRMFQAGVFGVDPNVELVDGEVLVMSPIGPLQGALIRRLVRFLMAHLPESIECSVQLPIVAGNHSEPQPDIALVRRREDDYQAEHPTPADVELLIELSQSSLSYDLGRKLQVYAECGIREYWVVNVGEKLIIVHREPSGATYRNVRAFGPGTQIAPLAAPDGQLDLEWLFR